MIYVTLTYIFGFLVVILGYTTINLLFKNEKAEDIILSQDKFLDSLFLTIKDSEKKLDELDQKGIFKSDDEIGWLFNEIKKLHNNISNFFNNRSL
jgi:hypothetical protein